MRTGLLNKLLLSVLTLLITLALIFILLRVIPTNPAEILLGDAGTPEQIAEVTRLWGLDKSIPRQFLIYVTNLLKGDAGISFQYSTPGSPTGIQVWDVVMSRVPYTVLLALSSLAFSILLAIPLGILTALKSDTFIDHFISSAGIFLTSMPNFWLALLAIELFSLRLGWLPSGGTGTVLNLVLPTIVLSLAFVVLLTRVTRTELLRAMRSDYVRTARAKGLSANHVIWRHALRNALIPMVTLIGLRLGGLLNGAVVVEAVFRWPGLGSLMINSIGTRDYPTIQVLVPLTALVFIGLNFLTDMVYGLIDPRVGDTKR